MAADVIIVGKIDVTKIDKEGIFVGKKGKYFDFALFENCDGPDEYGNDGFMVQNLPKEQRDEGKKNPIIANWRHKQGQEQRQNNYQPRDPDPIATYHKQHGTPSRGYNPPQDAKPLPPDIPF
jgi:hypothetical protein